MLKLRSFVKALFDKYIKARSLSLLILEHSTRVIKKAINKAVTPNIKDLYLFDIIVIKGFYINIISEACLNKIRV